MLGCVQGLRSRFARRARGRARPGLSLRSLPEGQVRSQGAQKQRFMALQVAEYSFELIELLEPLVRRIRARDRSLADQITRAASSIALNIAEGDVSDPGNQRSRFFTAAGSASETRAALRVAAGWRYLATPDTAPAHALLDRIIRILWKLTHR